MDDIAAEHPSSCTLADMNIKDGMHAERASFRNAIRCRMRLQRCVLRAETLRRKRALPGGILPSHVETSMLRMTELMKIKSAAAKSQRNARRGCSMAAGRKPRIIASSAIEIRSKSAQSRLNQRINDLLLSLSK